MRNPEEEYINSVLGQIRWKSAHPVIREELAGHIEEHKQDALKSGMNEAAAAVAAVQAMGDPAETGRRLDKLHRPKVDMLLLIPICILIAYGIMAWIYTITAQRMESGQDIFTVFMLIAFGLAAGILCAALDIRKAIGKNPLLFIISGLAGLLVLCLLSILIDFQYTVRFSNDKIFLWHEN